MEKSLLNGRDFHCTHFGFYSVAENAAVIRVKAFRSFQEFKLNFA
jgi:hypothetical protein